jgi:hypothetical protein
MREHSRAAMLIPLLMMGLGGCQCGVAAIAGDGGTAVASVTSNGDVVFVLGGRGEGCVRVLSTFPIAVPANGLTTVDVQFAPETVGAIAAQLLLQTAKMGVSTIALSGAGVAAD